MPGIAYGEGVEANFENALAASRGALGLAEQVGRMVPVLRAAREEFFATGYELLVDTAEPPFAKRFPTERDYFTFLARIGRDPKADIVEENDSTGRTVEVLERLHTPDTIVYLKTKVRGRQHLLGPHIAIGRVVGTPQPRLMSPGGWTTEKDLVLMVQTGTTKGVSRESEVGIADIAERFDRRVGPPGTASPLIVAGAAAVRPFVERAYTDNQYPTKDTQDAFVALTRSGLRLSELGYTDEEIAVTRSNVEANLRLVVKRVTPYRREAVKLPALYGTTREALQVLDHILDGKGAYEVDPDLGNDRNTLREYAEPEQ